MAPKTKSRPWARVPVEALEDTRLSPTEFRVLVTLLTYADGDTGWTWPTKRATIADRCGVSPQNISRATAALVRYGWIEKFGNGGKSCPAKYKIMNPLTCPESGQVRGDTRPESDTNTRPESDTNTRPDSGQRKEQTSFQTVEQMDAKRLVELVRILDRLPFHPDQANPVLASIADELGIVAGTGQTTHDFAQRLRRQIEARMERTESMRWRH